MKFVQSAGQLLKGATLVAGLTITGIAAQADTISLRGASLFDETHAYTKTLRKLEELIKEAYAGDIEFEMHLNGE